jgi:hypothetical protein
MFLVQTAARAYENRSKKSPYNLANALATLPFGEYIATEIANRENMHARYV